ncbi:MAG: replication associated protein [Chaetfec virus UA24_3359]|nr:MAG: replication associated protein [Chaetfec virus UA24_3359]
MTTTAGRIYKRMRNARSRCWCGTVWLEEDKEKLIESKYVYLLIGHREETQGEQPHWHCLIKTLNQQIHPRTINAHWEPCSKPLKFIEYATKEGPPEFEYGERILNQNDIDDWEAFIELCKTQNPRQLIEGPYSKLYARYVNFAMIVHNQFREIETLEGELQNEWWWGPAGTGKSRAAFEGYPGAYIKSLNKWWDGYHDQDVVIIDDWGPNQGVLVDHLKHWADRYPFPAECKGSCMRIRPKKLIVTSNYSIEQCFDREEDVAAIKRRFKVTRFHKPLGE